MQYREGSIDFNQVLSTLTQQTEQQDALTATTGTIATNLVNLYKVLGGGWQFDAERGVDDYANSRDQKDMLSRTSYWHGILPDQ